MGRWGVAEWLWREILLRPSRPVKLAKQFNVSRSTACRVLRRLEMFGLAQKIGALWHGVAAGADDLKRIAVVCSTAGRSERRREKHMQQRSRDVSWQLLKTKRRLEGLTRAEKRDQRWSWMFRNCRSAVAVIRYCWECLPKVEKGHFVMIVAARRSPERRK